MGGGGVRWQEVGRQGQLPVGCELGIAGQGYSAAAGIASDSVDMDSLGSPNWPCCTRPTPLAFHLMLPFSLQGPGKQ